jgi:hypothetical protein
MELSYAPHTDVSAERLDMLCEIIHELSNANTCTPVNPDIVLVGSSKM